MKHIGVTAALSRRDHAEAPGTMPLQDIVFREGKTETKSLLAQQVRTEIRLFELDRGIVFSTICGGCIYFTDTISIQIIHILPPF